MSNSKKISCIEFANQIKSVKGISVCEFDENYVQGINSFSVLWNEFGLSYIDKDISDRVFDFQEKYKCLEYWTEHLFPDNLIDINYLHRKILNDKKTNFVGKNNSFNTSTSLVEFELNGRLRICYCIDLVAFEIDSLISELDNVSDKDITNMRFQEFIDTAEKNLSYNNDSADEIALTYLKNAYQLKPEDTDLKQRIDLLDKIVNFKNYTYQINDNDTEKLVSLFVECCNKKGFERFYDFISDDFVCISRIFGRSKKGFINSIYYERISLMGLWAESNKYLVQERQIPCVKLNDYGVLFFNIEKEKIVRAFEYKIGDHIDRKKLTKK
jgi:hypothetical protein